MAKSDNFPHGTIDVAVVGDDRGVQAMLQRLDTALSPVGLKIFLEGVIDPYLQQRGRERFKNEGDEVVGSWAPLQPITQKIRQDEGFGGAHPINERTGSMKRYIIESPNRVTAHALGSTLFRPGKPPTGQMRKKVKTAQTGQASPPTVPRRVLGVNSSDLLFTLSSLAKYIQRGKL